MTRASHSVFITGLDGVATLSFVELLHRWTDWSVYLSDASESRYRERYQILNVKDVPMYSVCPERLRKIRGVGGLYRLVSLAGSLKGGEEFDCLHIQGMWPETLYLLDAMGVKANHVVCSYWGSDLLRAGNRFHALSKRWLSRADAITIQNRQIMIEGFHNAWGHEFDHKLVGVLYDIENRQIESLGSDIDKTAAKRSLGISPDKYVVAIGYNANPNHHHLEVISALEKLPEVTLERIHLIFPFTYPEGYDTYRQEVKNLVSKLPCTATYFEGWLDDEDVALMRLACDMFIHAQTSDAASASVIEFLKAGASLVNASWIDYCELRERGVRYREFSSYEELPNVIVDQLNDPNSQTIALHNREVLSNMNEENFSRDAWLSIYKAFE